MRTDEQKPRPFPPSHRPLSFPSHQLFQSTSIATITASSSYTPHKSSSTSPTSMADPSTTPDVTSRISLASTRSTPDVMSTSRASPKKDAERDDDDGGWRLSPSRVLLQSQQKPSRAEEMGWYLYGMCSYFIQTTLVPIIFPLIVAQIATKSVDKFEPVQGWDRSFKGLSCIGEKEMKLYVGLTQRTISAAGMTFSPLDWVSASWVVGLLLSAPVLVFASLKLDRGGNQPVIAAAATFVGAMFCLPSGFFKTIWIFPPYIAAIIVAHTVATACHTRHLGLMIHGYTRTKVLRRQFHQRRAISSWFSLYTTAAGCLGSALMCAFTYHMLANQEAFVSLWVVSIFSGIKWLVGLLHIATAQHRPPPPSPTPPPSALSHSLSVFTYPHAIGSLAAAFLSSLTTMCIFTAAVLYLVGQLCIKPWTLLYFWLTYFTFPLLSLPVMHPLQQLIRASTVKMQVLGFALSLITSGTGFYYRTRQTWRTEHVLLFAAVQSTSVGLLHAFGRVLVLDSTPYGKEGIFGAWHSWAVTAGRCVGFAVGAAVPGRIGTAFKVAFTCAAVGTAVLIFGNVSDSGGALAAGHVVEHIGEEAEIEADVEKERFPTAVNPRSEQVVVMKESEID